MPAPVSAVGPWTRSPGSVLARLTVSALRTDTFHTIDGAKLRTANFDATSVDLYAEIGLSERLHGVVRIPLLKRFAFETSEAQTAIGDLGVEAVYGVRRGRSPVSVGLGFDAPTGDADGATPLDGGGFIRLPTGDGEWNVRATVAAGRSFDAADAFVAADAGFNLRTEGYTDEWTAGARAGIRPLHHLRLNVHFRAVRPAGDPDRSLATSAPVGIGEGVRAATIGGGVAVDLGRGAGLSLDLLGPIGQTRNSYSGLNTVLGVMFER